MKVKSVLSVFLLTLFLCIGLASMPAFAASSSQDGLEVTLTTDKEEYALGEQIVATLTVKNTNDFAVNNVSLESMIPEDYILTEDAEAIKHINILNAGETVSLTVTYVSKNHENDGDQTSNEDDTGNSNTHNGSNEGSVAHNSSNSNKSDTNSKKSTVNKSTSKNGSNKANNAPTTGDDTNITFWITLLVLACAGIIILIILCKKYGAKILSLFLCVVMAGILAEGETVHAKAAELQGKSISISEKVTVDNNELSIEAIVKYDAVPKQNDAPTDVGDISFREPSKEHIIFDEATGDYYVDNEILITVQENTTREEIEKILKDIHGEIVGSIEITNDYQIEISEAKSTSELNKIVELLNENDLIEEAMLHRLYETDFGAVPNDTKWKSEEWSSDYPEGINWGVEAVDAMGAWEQYDQMSYVKVGIIDSMFDTNHEDLVYTKVWNNPQSISSESLDYFEKSHGTHVSGTIAACYNNSKGVAGVAPKVTLYGYSVMGSDSDSIVTDSNKTFMGFMEWKYALANLITSNCKVINVSMANHSDLEWQRSVLGTFLNKLILKGYDFVIVQAAGNDSSDATVSGLFTGITIPAVKDRIIIVGAIGNNGSHKNGLFGWFGDRVFDGFYFAGFSNYGNRVDVVAPGVKIYSTVPNNGYEDSHGFWNKGSWDGTSMATPHVTGIAAMCFSVNSNLTGAQVKSIVTNTASTTVTDTNAGHPRQNYRVVDADAALRLAMNTQGEAIIPINPSTGIVMGNVRGYDDNHQAMELENTSISAYRISNNDGNLSEYTSATQSDENGNYELILEAGKYYINIFKEGYIPFAICDVTVTNDQITYLDNVILFSASGVEAANYIHGTVRNAITGASIEGVNVQLRPGWDNKNGELAKNIETEMDAVTTTDSSGQYSFQVLEGCYTAEFTKDGYITGYANVICTNTDDADQGAVLTPTISDDEYRVVLTWSSTPSDLDSHISGPLSTGGRFHVFYNEKSAYDNDVAVAALDLDDTTSYGPETITLKKSLNGEYKYAVHDYTNRDSTTSTALSMSGAKVELYCGNSLVETYHVPINNTGTVWNVFEIKGNTIRTINTFENNADPSTVCAIATSRAAGAVMTINSESLDKDEISGKSDADNVTNNPQESNASSPNDIPSNGDDEDVLESDELITSEELKSELTENNEDEVISEDNDDTDSSVED